MTLLMKTDAAQLRRESPDEIICVLRDLEAEISNKLNSDPLRETARTGIPLLDWLVDQVGFVAEVWRRGIRDENDLWLMEMLSLPECLRRARSQWQRRDLCDHALVKDNLTWRKVLLSRKKKDPVEIYPRSLLDFHFWDLIPYRSEARWPHIWRFPAYLSLHRHQPEFSSHVGTLIPMGVLPDNKGFFTIELTLPYDRYILDSPRTYDQQSVLALLKTWEEIAKANISRLTDDVAHSPSALAGREAGELTEQTRQKSDLRDTQILKQFEKQILASLDKDIKRLQDTSQMSASKRSRILQKYLSIPMVKFLTPVKILPLDSSPNIVAMILGSTLFERGIFKRNQRAEFLRFLQKQFLIFDTGNDSGRMTERKRRLAEDRPIGLNRLGPLLRPVIKILASFNRPLRGQSVKAYLGLMLQRARPDQMEVANRCRVPKGELQRLGKILGRSPRTVSRFYREFYEEKGYPPSPDTWKKFKKAKMRKTYIRNKTLKPTQRGT